MKWDQSLVQRFSPEANTAQDVLSVQPILEISDDKRVLIENHLGVIQYSGSCICVKVRFGHYEICGCGLHLLRMTREQLVITGKIDSVTLLRRKRK